MKTRLNITIEDTLLTNIKKFAASNDLSVSQIVENYFRSLVFQNIKKKNIIDLVDELPVSTKIDQELDLKKSFYEDRSEKYGF